MIDWKIVFACLCFAIVSGWLICSAIHAFKKEQYFGFGVDLSCFIINMIQIAALIFGMR